MFRGCGGYMSHRFDPATHRCSRCGRWAPGFAPKKETVKPRAECQICERVQAIDSDGTLGHHGYRRPGWGSIYNDCFGEGYSPFPATDALRAWVKQLDRIIVNYQDRITALESGAAQQFDFTYKVGYDRRNNVTVKIGPGDKERYVREQFVTIPSYATMLQRALSDARRELALIPAERARVLARIAKGKQLTTKGASK